jgi:hypothetical protein
MEKIVGQLIRKNLRDYLKGIREFLATEIREFSHWHTSLSSQSWSSESTLKKDRDDPGQVSP